MCTNSSRILSLTNSQDDPTRRFLIGKNYESKLHDRNVVLLLLARQFSAGSLQ